jgi:hypothetical protein
MRKLISYTILALLATSPFAIAAPGQDQMMEKEKAAWQAFKDKDAAALKKVVSSDMVAVYQDGVADMQKELSDMQKWDMKSFEISDYKLRSIGPGLVISSYVVKIEGTYNGNDASGTYNAGSVWHNARRSGDWMAVFHTNVKQADGEMSAQKKE